MSINPFSYGRPIDDPARFIGRRREIEQVYSRLLSACESTSIVGESRTGKTSLLKILAQPANQTSFGIPPERFTFIFQDFQFIDSSTTPTRFWQRVLRSSRRALAEHPVLVEEIDRALKADTIDNYTLDDIFTLVDDTGLNIVLLLDEFENVTRNQQFDNDFFGGLRALAIHHNLALVTSSRHDLVELTHSEKLRSSPFFNIFATINLRAFNETEATELVDSYLKNTEIKFLLSELNMIFALAGYHPYFLQLVCYHLFAAHQAHLDDAGRRNYVMNQSRRETAALFQDYWHDSTPSQQILLTVMTMRELERGGEETIEGLEKYYARAPQVITELERRALVTKNPTTSAYHLFSSELREWIADEIVGSVDDLRAWRNWQKDETLIGVLPTTLQDMLAEVVRGLNPVYRQTFGNWLLDPATALPALGLAQNFVSRYEQYKQTRHKREPSVSMADAQVPVGDTPKGLFDLVNRQLEKRGQGRTSTGTMQPVIKPRPELKPEVATSTGRTLGKLKKKGGVSSIALGGLVISGIITTLDLDESDKEFVNGEIKWLFAAADHLLKVCRQEIDRKQPISAPIPPDAQKTGQATNRLLSHLDEPALQSWKGWAEMRLERLNGQLKDLDLLRNQEVSRGMAGRGDLELQNLIREKRLEIVRTLDELAQLASQAYGILVTSPGQLTQMLEEQ